MIEQSCVNLHSNTLQLSFKDSFRQISISLGTKYIPGKVWSIISRTADLATLNFKKSVITNAIIFEQYLVIAIMSSVGIILYFSVQVYQVFLLSVILAIVSSVIWRQSYSKITMLLMCLFRKYRKLPNEFIPKTETATTTKLIFIHIKFFLNLIAMAFPVVFLTLMLQDSISTIDLIKIAGAFFISITAGFLAIFAPGGLGAREATFIALTLPLLEPDVSALIILLHRISNVFIDCFLSGIFLSSSVISSLRK